RWGTGAAHRARLGAPADDAFFFQAEDGIRLFHVTGVQTCALPIYPFPVRGAVVQPASPLRRAQRQRRPAPGTDRDRMSAVGVDEIGRASCRERAEVAGLAAPAHERAPQSAAG